MLPISLLFFCCFPLALCAQFTTPYDPGGRFRNWGVKGKALPFVLGDEGGISALLGVEYGFAKNQSIGIDGFIELTSKSDNNSTDTAGVMHDVARYYHSTERALFLNYRYYFSSRTLRQKHGIVPYLLVFLRYGKIDQHYDPLYPLTSWLNNYETHYSGGLMAGSLFQLSHTGRLAVDVNTGIFLKQKDISTTYLHNHQTITDTSKPFGPGFRFAANLVYWFNIRKPKTP
jgi:hypothetical protein